MVQARGHKIDPKHALPIVVDDAFQNVGKTADVLVALEKLGLMGDVQRAIDGRHVRAGRGKMRARRYRQPKSLLIVATDTKKLRQGAGNLPGVDIVQVQKLNAEYLAPGGIAGRLTVFTESALKALEGF
jgi:large subunit ribosomal protein L4e